MKENIGVRAQPPAGTCDDGRCPWHGSLPVRGRTLEGSVRSAKASRTAIVEWHYHRLVTKYERYQRRKSRITAHNPPCIKAKEGDRVLVAECRPLSKTKSFVIVGFVK